MIVTELMDFRKMQTNILSNGYQRAPGLYPSYSLPNQSQTIGQDQPFSTDFNQRRKALAALVTTPRFYAIVGMANLFGLAVSHFTRMNIGKMMAGINTLLYLMNAFIQGEKSV